MPRTVYRSAYRAVRMLVTLVAAGALQLVAVVPEPGAGPPSAATPPKPELETDTDDATKERLTPAGTSTPEPMTPAPDAVGICPEGMVHVEGRYCSGLAHQCRHYIDEKRDRCAEFLPVSRCLGSELPLEFCIDRYEYPNELGQKPLLGMNWDEAVAICRAQGKRLCNAEEWTLACEGPGRLPYPYGYTRDKTACNIDKPYRFPDNQRYANPVTRAEEMARLDQRETSGSRPACVSGYGVFDLTGNADEWVHLERGSHQESPFKSALKGGYWGPVRNRCRPITATHNRWHSGYQIGLRCCRDVDASGRP